MQLNENGFYLYCKQKYGELFVEIIEQNVHHNQYMRDTNKFRLWVQKMT